LAPAAVLSGRLWIQTISDACAVARRIRLSTFDYL
jgi:hypothetical protein